jgi:two-component system, NarL family, sensor kinase
MHRGAVVFTDIAGAAVERELNELGARLIDAQEQERRRLSRELHDGVCQGIALVSTELAILRDQLAGSPLMRDRLDTILAHTGDLGHELHRLSHALYPAWLEQFGLARSIHRLCAELSLAYRITIDLETAAVPVGLASHAELYLYRIVQEALHNVVRHSGAARATVRLDAEDRAVVMSVCDDGAGFDPLADNARNGLGLISMRERIHQLEGQLSVTSTPGHGTRIDVRVPLLG